MKPRTAILFALTLLAIACGAYLLISENRVVPEHHSQREAAPGVPPSAVATTTMAPVADSNPAQLSVSEKEWEAIEAQMNGGLTNPSVAEADALRFLAKKAETPANVIAVWLCTRDGKWLDRALELHPKNAMVLFAKLGSMDSKALDPELIRRFNEAAPDNPLPKLFEARHSFNTGDRDRAIEAVQEALKRPGFYTWMNETTDASRMLYEFAGMPPVLADLTSTFQMPMPHLAVMQGVGKGLSEAFFQQGFTQSPADNANTIQMTYQLGRMFATPEASRTFIGQLVGISLEKRALDALPPDSKPDWLPVAPKERIAEIQAKKGGIPDAVANTEWLMNQRNADLLTQFLRRYRGEGEMAASQWLAGQRAAATGR